MLSMLFPSRPRAAAETINTSEKLSQFLLYGTNESRTGISVTAEQALRLSTVYACVKVLAETVGWLPVFTYRRLPRGKEKAVNHSLYHLLHSKPNRWQTPLEFKEMLQGHAALRGNGYAYKVMGRGGQVSELIPLHPGRMSVRQESDYRLLYTYAMPDGVSRGMTQAEVFHLRGMSTDGFTGMSVLSAAREAIGLGIAVERHGALFFKNGVRASGVAEHPQKLTDQAYERLKTSFNEAIGGDKLHSVLIMEEGLKWQQVGMNNEDAQFILTRELQVEDIARFFRMPPHKIGHLKRATNNNIEHQGLEFVTDTMMPWFVRWEQALSRDVFSDVDRNMGLFPEFQVTALLRGDSKSRAEFYAKALANRWMVPNEVRELENMNPVPWGDEPIPTPGAAQEKSNEQETVESNQAA